MRRYFVAAALFLAALPSNAAITGYVMNSDGQAIAAAKVETFALETEDSQRARLVSSTPDRPALGSATVDAKGKFTLESPKDPVVVLRVTANGFAPAAYRVERDEDAGALILTAAEMKTGRVTANGKPVANAKVIWDGDFLGTTDAEGRYKVPDPAKWASRVVILHPDHATLEETNAPLGPARGNRARTAAAQVKEAEPVDRSLSAGSPLSGTVVAEDGKTPVAGAAVSIDGWPVATSAQDGTFSIAHAPVKWNLITARTGALAGTRARVGATANVVVKLAKAASFSGSVRDMKTQAPIAGADVRLRIASMQANSEGYSAITDAKGNFAIAGIVPGSYQAFASRPGYVVPNVSVSLTANEKLSKTLIAAQLARVSGVIVDEQKRPVAAARVSPQQVSRGDGGMFGFMMMGRAQNAAASAPDGTFNVRADGDIDIELEAQKKGYPTARSSKLRLAPGERKAGVVLTIPSGVAVTGRVLDKQGKPVPAVVVTALDANSGGPAGGFARRAIMLGGPRGRDDDQVKTGNDGTFSIRVKEGTYDFGFRTDGYAAKFVRAVQIGASPKPLDVTLEPGVEVSGRVTRNGTGIEGVFINGMGEGGMVNAQTGADGSFRLTDLSPGQLMLSIRKEEEFIQQIRPVTAPASDVNIDLPAGERITGRVLDKTTKQPVAAFDAGVGQPRGGGGMVFMMPPSMRHFTSDDGSFTLENVPPGQTTLTVNAPGYTSTRVPNVNVEDGKTIADVEVDVDHGVRAVGHVTGPDGSPLAGVAVRLDMGGGRVMNVSPQTSSTMTDGNGDFSMDALESGDKTFVFSRSGFLTTQKSATLSGTETRVDAQLSTGTPVTGMVVSDAGVPIADASVNAQSAADASFGSRSTRTDANGNFAFEGLTPGRYTFNGSKTGYADGRLRDFDITLGAPPRIVLSSGGIIYGQVTGLSPDELQRATVIAQSPNGNASASVDASGSFRVEGAPLGTVRVFANAGGGLGGGKTSAVQSVQVDAGSQVQVSIAFKSDTVITGSVTRNGQAVQGAMINFSPKDATAQTRASTNTDSSGHYQVSGLDDATYNVTVVDIQRSAPYSSTYQVHGSGTFDVDMKAAALHGRVHDSDGNAVSEAIVEVRDKSDTGGMRMSRAVQTDASGAFLVDNVPAGSYTVSAQKDGYGTRAVDTVVDDSGGNVEITIAKNNGVTLRVVDARDGRLLNAQVHVTNAQNATVYDSPFFGGGSADAITLPLEPGSYYAEITAMGYAPQKVTINAPSNPTIGMTPGGTIVVQSKGSALRRARLLMPDGTEYSRGRFGGAIFTVDPSPGVTLLNNIAPGTYTLQILGSNNEVTDSAPVTVGEGQQASVSL